MTTSQHYTEQLLNPVGEPEITTTATTFYFKCRAKHSIFTLLLILSCLLLFQSNLQKHQLRKRNRYEPIYPIICHVHPLLSILYHLHLHLLSFIIHHLSFIIHPLSSTIHPLSSIIHHLSFIIHPLSFIIHPLSSIHIFYVDLHPLPNNVHIINRINTYRCVFLLFVASSALW